MRKRDLSKVREESTFGDEDGEIAKEWKRENREKGQEFEMELDFMRE